MLTNENKPLNTNKPLNLSNPLNSHNLLNQHNLLNEIIPLIDELISIRDKIKNFENLDKEEKEKILFTIFKWGWVVVVYTTTPHPPKFLKNSTSDKFFNAPLENIAKTIENENDRKAIYILQNIGYISKRILIELGMDKITSKKVIDRLASRGIIEIVNDKKDSTLLKLKELLRLNIHNFQIAKFYKFTRVGETIFSSINVDPDETFQIKVDELKNKIEKISIENITIKNLQRKIERKKKEDPDFRNWLKLNEFVANRQNRIINANDLPLIFPRNPQGKIKRLETKGFIERLHTKSVIAFWRVKTLDEVKNEGKL